LNLEIALGARARNPNMPIVLRIAEASFAASIARHFDFRTTYSAAALAAPAFAGLARMRGARGRIVVEGREFAIGEYSLSGEMGSLPPGAIAIAVARDNGPGLIHDFSGLEPGDRVLVLIPLVQYDHSDTDVREAEAETVPSESN
jgi:hypothetical protein